jgi:hypothetical protein
VETQYTAHALTPEQENQLFANCCRLELKARPVVRPSESPPYLLAYTGYGPPHWKQKLETVYFRVDDREIRDDRDIRADFIGEIRTGSHFPPQPIGRHKLRMRVKISIGTGDIWAPGAALLHTEERDLSLDFEVSDKLPADVTDEMRDGEIQIPGVVIPR